MPACRYVEEISLTAKRLAGVAPEMNPREHVTCMALPSVNKATHSGFGTQRRFHQKSKTGVLVVPQKRLTSSKTLKISLGLVSKFAIKCRRMDVTFTLNFTFGTLFAMNLVTFI